MQMQLEQKLYIDMERVQMLRAMFTLFKSLVEPENH